MHRFFLLAHRFRRDERGVFAVIFGLMAVVLVALGGAVVDYVSLEQSRNRSQIALDAAALALQPQIFGTAMSREQIRVAAENLMLERLNDDRIIASVDQIVIDVTDGSLFLSAHLDVPTMFVSLVGVNRMEARVTSEATRRRLNLEVAMVLDNSGSMDDYGRMTALKSAANCATNILYYGNVDANCNRVANAPLLDNVKLAVVPFTGSVNVGAGYANSGWIDRLGASPISRQNFDNDDDDSTAFTGTVNRLALFDQLTNVDWGGCVEARPHTATVSGTTTNYYDTNDFPPATGVPASLFVPLFVPDMSEQTGPQDNTGDYRNYANYTNDAPAACNVTGTCSRTARQSSCNSSYSSCGTSTGNWSLAGANTGSLSCSCSTPTVSTWRNLGNASSGRYRERTETCSFSYAPQDLSERETTERLCKYTGAVRFTNNQRGPNGDCPVQAIRPLTRTPSQVTTAITNMTPAGATNIHEGAAWGFRVLSPTLPFNEGNDYDEATSKIMILMTDGENTAYHGNFASSGYNSNPVEARMIALNGSRFYSAYGWPKNSNNPYFGNVPRLGGATTNSGSSWSTSQLITEMNARTLQTCTNAKLAGITIFTVGLGTDQVTQSTPAVVRDMLQRCSSPDGGTIRYFFPTQSSELTPVFRAIAEQLAALRLAQ